MYLLASSGKFITSYGLNLFAKPLNQMKIACVVTAAYKVYDMTYLEEQRQRFKDFNFTDCLEIDLTDKTEAELRQLLADREVIYVIGGNTYYLLKYARQSGLVNILRERVGKDLIYLGASAGTYLVCPTIVMATWKEPLRQKPAFNRCGVTDLTGLGLIPFNIFVHYTSTYRQLLLAQIKNLSQPLRILNDNQAFLIKNNQVTLVGQGKEIKLFS